MDKRLCFNCNDVIPPETEHYEIEEEVYCILCVDPISYTSYSYYVGGEYMGDSDDDHVRHIESYEDDCEGSEA